MESIDEIKFDEYKLFIEDTARFTDRRQNTSNLFVTVNSLLLTAMGFIIADTQLSDAWMLLFNTPLIVAGIYVSRWWGQLLHRYRLLGRLRFKVLREMESSKELAGIEKMYHREDELYPRNDDGTVAQGVGLNFSDLESKLPSLFIKLYIATAIGILIALFIHLAIQGA